MGFLRIVVVVVVSLYGNRLWKLSRLSSHAPVVNVWRASASISYRRAHPSLWDGKSFNWNVGWNLPASSCWSGTKAGLCRNVGCGPSLRSWGLGHARLFRNKNCHPLFAPHIYDPQDFTLIDPLPSPPQKNTSHPFPTLALSVNRCENIFRGYRKKRVQYFIGPFQGVVNAVRKGNL